MTKVKKYVLSVAALMFVIPVALGFAACGNKDTSKNSNVNFTYYMGLNEGDVVETLGAGQSINKIVGTKDGDEIVVKLATAPTGTNKAQLEVGLDNFFTDNGIVYSNGMTFKRETATTAAPTYTNDSGAEIYARPSASTAANTAVMLDKHFVYIKTAALQSLTAGNYVKCKYTFGTGANAKVLIVKVVIA
jgi:hypothetical protein